MHWEAYRKYSKFFKYLQLGLRDRGWSTIGLGVQFSYTKSYGVTELKLPLMKNDWVESARFTTLNSTLPQTRPGQSWPSTGSPGKKRVISILPPSARYACPFWSVNSARGVWFALNCKGEYVCSFIPQCNTSRLPVPNRKLISSSRLVLDEAKIWLMLSIAMVAEVTLLGHSSWSWQDEKPRNTNRMMPTYFNAFMIQLGLLAISTPDQRFLLL